MDEPKKREQQEQQESAEVHFKSGNGLVGFFDILGYKEFLVNNTPQAAAEKVLGSLLKLKKQMPQGLLEILRAGHMAENAVEVLNAVLWDINWLVFSDTILITLGTEKPNIPGLYYGAFLMQCSHFWRTMFDFGLPLRGAITEGDSLIQESCFAGKSIVEAYTLANDLKLAGVIIREETHKSLAGMIEPYGFAFPYLLPSKSKGFRRDRILNVSLIRPHAIEQPVWDGDIRQMVHESFWKHGKEIGEGVGDKVDNTEQLLRFLKSEYPKGFAKAVMS